MCFCYMINWSIVCVLNLSIAHSNLHKLTSLMVLALVALWEFRSSHSKLVHIVLGLLRDGVVGADFFLNFTEVSVLVHSFLSDRNHSIHNIPEDTLYKWSGRQGALIGESSVEVNERDKFLEVEGAFLGSSSPFQLHFSMLLLVNQG
jgi:hypothetical protein